MLRRAALVAYFWLAPLFVAAHPWHGDGPSLTAANVEKVVAMLEATLDAAKAMPEPPKVVTEGGPLALFVAWTGADVNQQPLPVATDPVLTTASAMIAGVLLPNGQWADDPEVFSWVGMVNPADAEVVGPFLPRLRAWHSEFREVLE